MNVLNAEWSAAELHERGRRADEYRKRVRRVRQTKARRLIKLALRALAGVAVLLGWGTALLVLLG
ncbi:MAG: hypothetical protein AB7E30_05425 [Lawsonibacter sp.]